MDAPTMIKRVSEGAGVDRSRSVRAIEGTLRILAERINGDEAEQLAAQLPPELTESLLERSTVDPEAHAFGRDEFVRRFDAAISREDDAEALLQTTFEVLSEAVDAGEWGDVLAQLPSDMDDLFLGDKPSRHQG